MRTVILIVNNFFSTIKHCFSFPTVPHVLNSISYEMQRAVGVPHTKVHKFFLKDNRDLKLVSIHSQEEQDFLWNIAMTENSIDYKIGLDDLEQEDDEKWTDGSPVDYRNHEEGWGPNGKRTHNCFALDSTRQGVWIEDKCLLQRQGILQRKG